MIQRSLPLLWPVSVLVTRLFGEPIVILSASLETLQCAMTKSVERDLTRAAYVTAMFQQTHGDAGREAFRTQPVEFPDLVGLAVRGPRKDVDTATKGASLHP